MNILKVITPDNLGKGITFNPQTKQWEVQSGFDCAALSALPSKPWKKGTTLLAKQDGECIQLAALDSIFQEIGVGIAADKTSAFTGETYNVTVTVTNTGESKNELTNLTVQKPLLGNYEIQDVRTSKQGVDEVETLDQLNYNLKGLAKGGTFILRFSVKANDVGTYQFSATVNPNSALDQNAKNNTDTIILKANTKIDTTYVPSVDCPRITATELDSNTELAMLQTSKDGGGYLLQTGTISSNNWNIFANRDNLNGLRIQLNGASTILVFAANDTSSDHNITLSNGRLTYSGHLQNTRSLRIDHTSRMPALRHNVRYTFQNGVLEITDDIGSILILCRPAGQNCVWQVIGVTGAKVPNAIGLTATNIKGGEVRYENSSGAETNNSASVNIIPSNITRVNDYYNANHQYPNSYSLTRKLIFSVKSGSAASLDFNASNGWVRAPITSGKTTITENQVTVAADATSTDSINSEFLQVIVED